MIRAGACAVAFLLLALPAAPDEVHLKNGNKIVGKVTEEGDKVKIAKSGGITVTIARDQIEKIVYTKDPEPEPKPVDPPKPPPPKPPDPKAAESEPIARRVVDHGHEVHAFALTPDGTKLVTAGQGVKLWSLETGEKIREFGESGWKTSHLAISRDGKKLVTGADQYISLWEGDTGVRLGSISHTYSGPNGIATLADGRVVVMWGVALMVADAKFEKLTKFLEGDGFRHLGVAGDGKTAATVHTGDVVRVWDLTKGKELRSFPPEKKGPSSICSVTMSPDAKLIAVGTTPPEGLIRLVDASTGRVRRVLSGHGQFVLSLAFSPDGKKLLSGGGGDSTLSDTAIRVWDADSGDVLGAIVPRTVARKVAWHPDGKRVVYTNDKTVVVCGLDEARRVRIFDGLLGSNWAWLAADGKRYVSISSAEVCTYEVASGKPAKGGPMAHSGRGPQALSPDGERLATANGESAQLYDLAGRKAGPVMKGERSAVDFLLFSPDGKSLLIGWQSGMLRLVDAASGKERWEIKRPQSRGHPAFCRKGARLFLEDGGSFSFFDAATGAKIESKGRAGDASALGEAPTGELWSFDASTSALTLWNPDTLEQVRTFGGGTEGRASVSAYVSFSADGRRVCLSGGLQRTIVWDVATGEELDSLHWGVFTLMPDGKGAFECQRTPRIWELRK
jgi:WD40 repeat protein